MASSAEIRRKKSFKKKNFVSRVQVKSEWVIIKRRGRGEMNERERFPDCLPVFVRALSACGHGGNFSFLEGVFFLIYDIVSRASTVDEGGADQTRFLDRIPAWTSIDVAASRDNFGQSPVPLVIFLAREKGVKCLSSISNRKFRDQIHPRFEARYYFSVNDER